MSNQFADLTKPTRQHPDERLAVLLENAIYDALEKQEVRVSAWSLCCALWLYTITTIPVFILVAALMR